MGKGAGMVFCEECGCSGALGKGWVADTCNDPDALDEPRLVVYSPVCAAADLGHQPDVAATYVCAWEPLLGETAEGI